MASKKYITMAKIIVSILAILLLISFLDPKVIMEILPRFNLLYLPLFVLFIFLNVFLYVVNYWLLLSRKFSLFSTLKDYFVMWSFGLFLPGKIGELGIIPILKKKHNVPYKFAVAATIFPKLAMVFVFLGVLIIFGTNFSVGLFGENSNLLIWTSWLIGAGAIICIVAGILILAFSRKVRAFVLRIKIIKDFWDNRKSLVKMVSPWNLILIFVIAILRFLSFVLLTFFAYVAFGFIPSFEAIAVAVAISQVVVFIPITLNGLGLREATFSGAMTLAGVPLELSVGVVAVSLIVNYFVGIVILVLWNLKLGKVIQKKN